MFMAYGLKKGGLFQERDFRAVTKIIMNITMPAVIVHGFAGFERNFPLLGVVLLVVCFNLTLSFIGYLINYKNGPESRAFHFINYSGYNIGCFSLPYLQSFLSPIGMATVFLFDIGNSLTTCGGSYAVASHMLGEKRSGMVKGIVKSLLTTVPFVTYLSMFTIAYMGLRLPEWMYSVAGTLGSGNAFLAMFMLGGALELSKDLRILSQLFSVVLLRNLANAALALAVFFFLPFSLEVRQVLVILIFSPFAALTVVFTGRLGLDQARSAFLNSMSIPVSLIIITFLMSFFQLS